MKLIADRCPPPEERGGGEAMADSLLSLTRLRLDRLELGSMDGLGGATAQHAYLQHNRISRIEGLEFFSDLRFLVLGANEIEAIEGLAHLRALEYLDLSQNRIADAAAHELPAELRALDLYGNLRARARLPPRASSARCPLFRLDDVAVSARERGHTLLEEEAAAEAVLEEAREALAPPRPPPPRAAAAEAQLDAAGLADATRLYEHAMSLHGVEAEAAAVKTKARQIRERVQKRREQAVEEQAALRERLGKVKF